MGENTTSKTCLHCTLLDCCTLDFKPHPFTAQFWQKRAAWPHESGALVLLSGLWRSLLVDVRTCLPLWVTEDRMVRRVLMPMAMSRRWAAKKKLLKCPKMDTVEYQIKYRKYCRGKKAFISDKWSLKSLRCSAFLYISLQACTSLAYYSDIFRFYIIK